MVYDGVIEGKFVKLRSIDVGDAEFSFNARNDGKAKGKVGQQVESIETQRNYIIKQREQPGDYYFVVTDRNDNPIGLYGIYDISGDTCEIGREVCLGNAAQALETEILAIEFVRDILKLKYVTYVIYTSNKHHVKMQEKLGHSPKQVVWRAGVECNEYVVSVEKAVKSQERIKSKLAKLANHI